MAECFKRQLNRGSFVLLYFRLLNFSDLYWVCLPVFSCTILFVTFVSISQVIGCEDRLRNDLYCVEWGVKLYSNQPTKPAAARIVTAASSWCRRPAALVELICCLLSISCPQRARTNIAPTGQEWLAERVAAVDRTHLQRHVHSAGFSWWEAWSPAWLWVIRWETVKAKMQV